MLYDLISGDLESKATLKLLQHGYLVNFNTKNEVPIPSYLCMIVAWLFTQIYREASNIRID